MLLLLSTICFADVDDTVFTPSDRYEYIDYKGIRLPDFLVLPEDDFDNCVSVFHYEGKTLIYVGCRHTNDKNSLLWKTISDLVEEFKPDVCITEGFDGKNNPDIVNLVTQKNEGDLYGENLHTVKLCLEKGIDFIGADIPEKEYIGLFSELGFTTEDLIFFLTERHIPFWRRDGGFDEANAACEIENFMNVTVTGWLEFPEGSYTFEQLEKWHEDRCGKPLNLTKDLLWSGKDDPDSMPCLLPTASYHGRMSAHIMHLRDHYIVSTIQKALKKHDTVLVVYGASHYLWQFQALRELFGVPHSLPAP